MIKHRGFGAAVLFLIIFPVLLISICPAFAENPAVSLAAPVNGSVLNGTVILSAVTSAAAHDFHFVISPVGQSSAMTIAAIPDASKTSWKAAWYTRSSTNGSYTVQAQADGEIQDRKESQIVTVTVQNAALEPFKIISFGIKKPLLSTGASIESARDFLVMFNRPAKDVHLRVQKHERGELVTDYFYPFNNPGQTSFVLSVTGLEAATAYSYGVGGLEAADTGLAGSAASTGDVFITATPLTGSYDREVESVATPDIDTDKSLVRSTELPLCAPGARIIGSLPSIYYCGADGRRYVFPNERVYASWYANFYNAITLSDETLAKIPLGGNVTYRPGIRMLKMVSDPRVYAVTRDGMLRLVPDEAMARKLYGDNWNKMIDDVPDAFWLNYKIGEPITS